MAKTFQFRSDERGSTAIEFALLAPALFLIVFGIIEFSIIMFTSSVVESSTNVATRFARTGNLYAEFAGDHNDQNGDGQPDYPTREAFLRAEIAKRTFGLLKPEEIVIESKSYATVNDVNRNDTLDALTAGGSSQAVLYSVSYDWPILTPLASMIFGDSGKYHIQSAMVVKNEAF